jgi:hypothetical protein
MKQKRLMKPRRPIRPRKKVLPAAGQPPQDAGVSPQPDVPDMRTWYTPYGQPRPPVPVLQNDPGPWVPRPPELPPGVPNPHFDVTAQIAAQIAASQRRQFVHAAQVALGFPRQEQPDHPRSHTSPGVQDPPTEPASPLRVALEGRGTISSGASAAEMTTSRPVAPDPQALHKEMLRRIASLEEALAQLVAPKPGIGHNNPPELIEQVPFGDLERNRVATAIAVVKAQPPEPAVAPAEATEAASWLNAIGERLAAYLDSFCSEAAKSAGSEFGKRLIQGGVLVLVAERLIAAGHAVTNWIASLTH